MKASSLKFSSAKLSHTLWRISNYKDLAGVGGEKAEGRWHTIARGKRIVYLSEHPAVALIEALANLEGDPGLFPESFQLIKAEVNRDVTIETIDRDTLPGDWDTNFSATQSIGDTWLAENRSSLLGIPSVPSPESLNYLYNLLHKDAREIVVTWSKRLRYDKRLFHIQQAVKT